MGKGHGFSRRRAFAGRVASGAIIAALAGVPALAQVSSPPAPPPAPLVSGDPLPEEAGEAITVTGSRIKRAGYDTLEPATVISSEYLGVRGLTNVADAINELPGFGVGVNPEGNQAGFGVGQNFVNRFGLGSARTLTLVNGRRFVSTNAPSIFANTPGLQVDLNVIPAQLVDRIENIAIGGAPTYGSDAIAGTVNVILKKNYEGVSIQGLGGVTERGDNGRYNASVLAGHNFSEGRGNITIAGSYDKSSGVLAADRKRFSDGIATGTNPTAGTGNALIPGRTPATDGRVFTGIGYNTGSTDGIPSTVTIRNARIFSLTNGGLLFPTTATLTATGLPAGFGAGGNVRLQFDSAGNLVPYNTGTPFGVQNASGGDGYDLVGSSSQLTTDLERITGNLIGHYDFTDHVHGFVEGTYYRAKARELTDQPIFNATLFGGSSAPLTFQATDPRLSTQARATLASLGVTSFRLSRASTDLVVNNASSTTNVYRGVAGFNGDFTLFGKTFDWETYADIGHSRGTFTSAVLNQQRFVNAINNCVVAGVTPANNVAPGGVLPIADASCVPLNVFGDGAPSALAKAYVTGRAKAVTVIDQRVYNANVGSSSILTLWSGDVGFNLGYEHRLEKASFSPDSFLLGGLGRSVPIGANTGKFNTNEAYAELLVPLVGPDNHVPLVKRLEAEAKARYVRNTVNGGFWTYTYGGRYQPISDIEFRGNYTRSLRAPSIVELFTPVSPAFNTFPDPCDVTNITAGVAPATRARNCAAFFAAYGLNGSTFSSQARVATVPVTSGGNSSLANEEGRAYTFGVVLKPRFLPRFRAAVDWNRIEIRGNIAQLTPANIAEGCYDNPNFNAADVDNANQYCSLIRRDRSADPLRNGQLSTDATRPAVSSVFVNGAFIKFKGLTAEAEYNFPLDGIGIADARIDLGGQLFYLNEFKSSNNGVTVNNFKASLATGSSLIPVYSGQLNAGITYKRVGVSLQANYTGKMYFDRTATVETRDVLTVGDYWLFNLGTTVKVTENSEMRFVVSNLFDRAPPFPLTTNGFGLYDYLGRRFAASFNFKF